MTIDMLNAALAEMEERKAAFVKLHQAGISYDELYYTLVSRQFRMSSAEAFTQIEMLEKTTGLQLPR